MDLSAPSYGIGPPLTLVPGYRLLETIAQPGAGGNVVIDIPGDEFRYLLYGIATFSASATVATRYSRVFVYNQDNFALFRSFHTSAITAGTQWYPNYGPDNLFNVSPLLNVLQMPTPRFWLSPGDRVELNAYNIQSSDQWSAITMHWLVVPKGQGGYPPRGLDS